MKKNKKLKNNTKTNYDGIAKQLLDYLNDENIIRFINFVFSKNFSTDSNIVRLAAETYDSDTKQKRCDYYIRIENEFFLIEFQSYDDTDMAMRIFEYGVRGARLHSKITDSRDRIVIQLPEPVVFFLRKDGKALETLSVEINIPKQDRSFEYTAKAVYVEDFTFSELIQNYMFPVIPFHCMKFEKVLYYPHTEHDEKDILEEFEDNYKTLKEAFFASIIEKADFKYIVDAMVKVFEGVIKRAKMKNMLHNEKEAKKTMERIIDEPIEMFDIYKALADSRDEGRNEGRNEGWNEGRNKGRSEMIEGMREIGLSEEQIQAALKAAKEK